MNFYIWIGGIGQNPESNGVILKIFDQIEAFNNVGIKIIGLTVDNEFKSSRSDVITLSSESELNEIQTIHRFIEESRYKIDNIYFRYPTHQKMKGMLKFLFSYGDRIIFEHNSKEIYELLGEIKIKIKTGNILKYTLILYQRMWGELIVGLIYRQLISNYICVSSDIQEHQIRKYQIRAKSAVIPNGILKRKIQFQRKKEINLNRLKFVCLLGYKSEIVALNRIFDSLIDYNGIILEFDLFGHLSDDDMQSVRRILEIKSSLIKVNFFTSTDEVDIKFEQYDVGIGSLGFHRKNLFEASPLKSRTYYSNGLPVIGSYIDSDLLDENSINFYLRFQPDESNIDINKIIEFVRNYWQSEVEYKTMNWYCLNRFSWESKYQDLDIMKTIE